MKCSAFDYLQQISSLFELRKLNRIIDLASFEILLCFNLSAALTNLVLNQDVFTNKCSFLANKHQKLTEICIMY